MRNLHKYYYKDYFSEHIVDVDKNNDDKLLFEHLYLSEEKENEHDKEKKNKLSKKISTIETGNESILKFRNTKLTGTDFVKKDLHNNSTRDLLDDAEINLDKAITSSKVYKKVDLDIQYPGLVTGVGIGHETKIAGEFKLGVHFDWTHGMPVVYGSSVKGVLKSYFKDFYTPKEGLQPTAEDAIEDIFNGGKKSIYNRDVFFDAVIVKAAPNGRILSSDSITPHLQGPLKNPIPITFLKIAPGCKLEFRFKLVPTEIVKDGKTLKITEQEKLEIFKKILTTVGIGAKTNVGYGQLK